MEFEPLEFGLVMPTNGTPENVDPSSLDADRRLELIVSIIVPIFFSLIGITGFIGNLLVIITVLFNQNMRGSTNLYLLNLSIADLLFVVFCIPFTAVDYSLASWPFGNMWCKMVQYLIFVSAYISIFTLVLMSFERFLAVCYPVTSFKNSRNTIIIITILWMLVLVINLPVFHAHGIFDYMDDSRTLTSCTFVNNDFMSWSTFHIYFFITSYLLPLILITGLYLAMLQRLWKSNLVQSHEAKRGKRRVTRLVLVVVFCFASLWLPIQLILLLKSFDKFKSDNHLNIALQISAHIFAYTSSCINPILYAFLSLPFRKAFRKIVYCDSSSRTRYQQGVGAGVMPITKITRTSQGGSL